MYKVKSIKRTCIACPSQWEGYLEDGKSIYIRYRFGYLSVDVSRKPSSSIGDAINGKTIIHCKYGDGLDGFMELSKVIELCKNKVDFSNISVSDIDSSILVIEDLRKRKKEGIDDDNL